MRGLRYRLSLASRVTLLATIAVGLSVAIVAVAAYMTVRVQMQSTLDESLLSRADAAAHSNALNVLSQQRIPSWALGAADVRIAFVNTRDGSITTADRGPMLVLRDPELDVARGTREQSVRTTTAGDTRYRVVAVPAGPGAALVLAQSLAPNDRTLDRLGLVLLFFGLAGVIAAGLAGWAVARNGLRPVRRLTTAAEEIARTEELEPITVDGKDEIARLATAFNAMLSALAASRDRERQLIADAGHELKTPLTSLRTNLDLLAQADRSGGMSQESRQELLGDVRAQIEELSTLIGDLVELARDEPLPHTVEPVDLAEVVDRAVARVRLRAPNLELAVTCEPWWVTGDPNALERAVTNLLDNAAKWSPPLGTVTIRLRAGTLLVEDQGHGIAEEDLPFVFDRFFRSTESRPMPGSGLGLSIVRQVAERHGGSVHAGRAHQGGAAFWFVVPGSPTEPRASGAGRAGEGEHRPAQGTGEDVTDGAGGTAGEHGARPGGGTETEVSRPVSGALRPRDGGRDAQASEPVARRTSGDPGIPGTPGSRSSQR